MLQLKVTARLRPPKQYEEIAVKDAGHQRPVPALLGNAAEMYDRVRDRQLLAFEIVADTPLFARVAEQPVRKEAALLCCGDRRGGQTGGGVIPCSAQTFVILVLCRQPFAEIFRHA